MTRKELRDYVEEQRNLDVIPYHVYSALIDGIDTLEQEPKMGKWIDDKCSICGKGIEDLIDSREWYECEQPNFCPFCGVQLVKPQIESEGKK